MDPAAYRPQEGACAADPMVDRGPEGHSGPPVKKRRAAGLKPIDYGQLEEFRRQFLPLSKEQLLEILARASAVHEDVYATAKAIADESPAARRLMIRNIAFCTHKNSLYQIFSQFGSIEDYTIVRDKETQKSKGFGFVTFKNVDSVQQALSNAITLDGRTLFVKLAADSQSDAPANALPSAAPPPHQPVDKSRRKIFVRNLSDATTTDRLCAAFAEFGQMEDCVVVTDPITGKRTAPRRFTRARESSMDRWRSWHMPHPRDRGHRCHSEALPDPLAWHFRRGLLRVPWGCR
eukprot:Polyplicarium_translucidae@DN1029_c0_g1_i2.p1